MIAKEGQREPPVVRQNERPYSCAAHKKDGMVNVVTRPCLHEGCAERPSFGDAGDRKALY